MKNLLVLAALVASGCGANREFIAMRQELAQLRQELAMRPSQTPLVEQKAPQAETPRTMQVRQVETVIPSVPQVAQVFVGATPRAPSKRVHTIHNWTEGLWVAVQVGTTFAPVLAPNAAALPSNGRGILIPGATPMARPEIAVMIGNRYEAIPAMPPAPAKNGMDASLVFPQIYAAGQPPVQDVTFYCIEEEADGRGIIVGRFQTRVKYGYDGYAQEYSTVMQYNCHL